MMQSHNAREQDVERRLSGLESPAPPTDLLDRIRGDIPEHLRPLAEAEAAPPDRRHRYRLLAAALFLVVAGGILSYRVFRSAPQPLPPEPARTDVAAATDPLAVARKGPGLEAPGPVTTEVGVDPEPEGAQAPLGPQAASLSEAPPAPPPAPDGYPPAARAQTAEADEAKQEPAPASEYAAAPAGQAAPTPGVDGSADALEAPPRFVPPLPPAAPAEAEPRRELAAAETHKAPAADDAERLRAAGSPGGPERRLSDAPPTPPAPSAPGRRTSYLRRPGIQAAEEELRAIEVGPRLPPAPGSPSTGGTAEPNDQPWGDMFFRPYGTNPFVDTEDDALSTFGLDVDTGSYTLARSYLERGHLPPPAAIRVEEFVNFFDYRDAPPRRGEFTLTAEGAPSPWPRGPRYQLLRIGLHGREISTAQRRDATLVFVVDVSGSMARGNRLGLVQQALRMLLDQLTPGDRVGLVVYGSRGRVLLEPSGDLAAVRRAIDRLTPGGSTNAEEGLVLGYELARRHFQPGSIHRLVLCSDGVANVGRTGPESILARVERAAGDGIELTTVGFGMGNYNDVMMEQLADRGDGNYAYVDTLEEARRIFVENLTGTLQTIASDAKIQVEFDPAAVSRYRLLGYENRDVADHRFRDDSVDAGEIGAGHRVTALYEIKLTDEPARRRPLAEVRLRYRSRQTGRVVEDSLEIRRSDLARSWRAAPPSLRLAALAAELAEVLKRSYWAREIRPEGLRQRAREVRRQLPGDRDVAQLVELVETAARLVAWPDPAAPGSPQPWED